MTNWPNIDQYSPVFTTGMPQVDRAETAVKNDTGKLLKPSRFVVEMGSINNPVDSNINTEKYRMDRRPGCLMRRSVSVMRRMRLEARSSLSWLITSVEYHHDRPFEVSLFEEDSSKSLDMVPASRHTDGVMVYGCNCKPKPRDNRLRGTACGVQ